METLKMPCPICRKRSCDIGIVSGQTDIRFFVELKCPNCRNIVKIGYPLPVSAVPSARQ